MGCFRGFLCMDGNEVINHEQSFHYLNTLGHPGSTGPIPTDCLCSGLGPADNGTGSWTTPADDGAWWYDTAIPESADVVAVYLEDMTISSPYSRETKDKLWGAALNAPSNGAREVILTGWVLTKSDAATDYMRRALFGAFGTMGCEGCTAPDMSYWAACPLTGDRQLRTLRQVGLKKLDTFLEPNFKCCWGFKFQATFGIEIPLIQMGSASILYDGDLLVGEPVCNICNPCPTVNVVDYACGCLNQTARVVPEPDQFGCYAAPITVARNCFVIPPIAQWSQAVMNFDIFSGSDHNPDHSGLRNLRIRGWGNPVGIDVDTSVYLCDEPCIDIEVSCLPAQSTLTIDSLARSVKITKDGAISRGSRYLSSGGGRRFNWPSFDCVGLVLCIDADGDGTAPDAQLTMTVQEFQSA